MDGRRFGRLLVIVLAACSAQAGCQVSDGGGTFHERLERWKEQRRIERESPEGKAAREPQSPSEPGRDG